MSQTFSLQRKIQLKLRGPWLGAGHTIQFPLFVLVLVVLLPVSILITMGVGAYPLSAWEVWAALTGQLEGQEIGTIEYLVREIRLPRILLSGFVGAALAMAGAAIQGLFRNPLADPQLIGVSSGALLAAVLTLVGLHSVGWVVSALGMQAALSIGAFLGGLGSTFLVYFLATRQGYTSVLTMLLAGIALSALAGALSGLMIYLADDNELRDITFWSLGSFSGASWNQLYLLIPVVFIGGFMLQRKAPALQALLLGEKEAAFLGVRVQRLKLHVILLASLLVGLSIAFSGMIGFVGLLVPHLIRLLGLRSYPVLLPSAAALGALLLIWADTFARTIIDPAELPIGIITSALGAPFFLWLLLKNRNKEGL